MYELPSTYAKNFLQALHVKVRAFNAHMVMLHRYIKYQHQEN